MSAASGTGSTTPRSSSTSARTSVSIETTVTKLLMSTKHLLQILTQWSKGAATGKMVSDSYVQLGNDFKLVSKFFTHAKVDISDVGDVPTQLRKVLEVTLREPPSDTTLNKYLPSIREIIVRLLDKLKVKQMLLKQARQEQLMAKISIDNQSSSSSASPSISSPSKNSGKELSATPSQSTLKSAVDSYAKPAASRHDSAAAPGAQGGITPSPTLAPPKNKVESPVPAPVQSHSPKSVLAPPAPTINIEQSKAPEPDENADITGSTSAAGPDKANAVVGDSLTVSKVRDSADTDALEQLKNGTNLQRRASKRYSAYHMAKLTNQSTMEAVNAAAYATSPVPNMPNMYDMDNNKSPSRIASTQMANRLSSHSKRDSVEQNALDGEYTVFLKLNGRTKKCVVPVITNINNLRLLFVERFAYSPGGNTFPDVYITDPHYNVPYELDEQDMGLIKDGSILELRVEENSPVSSERFETLMKTIKQEISNSHLEILKHLEDSAPVTSSAASTGAKGAIQPAPAGVISKSVNITGGQVDFTEMKRQLMVLKQLYLTNKSSAETSIGGLKKKLEEFKSVSIDTGSGVNKEYVEKSQSTLSDISDGLLTSVDDLQDVIEILRKDVADRGSRPTAKKLDSVESELKNAQTNLSKMEKFITTEKPHWKTIWETALDKVCEEQQFLSLQEDLLFDLKEDLEKANETFNLIHLCCEEQEKNPTKPRVNPILPILKPGTFNQVREQVMVAVESINPNHEERLDALGKAEKHWEREKKYKEEDEFKDELGNFVEQSHLKKSGGVEEIERLRREKDEANLRATFGGGMAL
ncbi:Bud6 protein [Maudiozyma humilis]|uniref:Bud6 protein n=1 Tax=Maudiozyma humilis TaxID=51915 RepID=A0AAV5S0K2_MAUHU|nr:Bud6 protein [Kazachstania humilis]